MRLAIDAMGNDRGCAPIIAGVRRFLEELDSENEIILVGREDDLKAELVKNNLATCERISIRNATQVMEMGDKIEALREKRDSSILRLVELHRSGEADAIVALGNTAAVVAAARLGLRHIKGVHRSGIAVPMPHESGFTVVIDMGANVIPKPQHLYAYGIMASDYAELVLGITRPRVGLLNVGEEVGKGNELLQEAYELLSKSPVNFIGNVEGGDIFDGTCDVVVCDGFVGNAVLKSAEQMASAMMSIIRNELMKTVISRFGALLCRGAFRRIKKRLSYEQTGGAPLLGVDGVCIVGHGRSNDVAVMNALRVARESVSSKLNDHIRKTLETNT